MLPRVLPLVVLSLMLSALPDGVSAAPAAGAPAPLVELSALDAPWKTLRDRLAAERPGEPLLAESLSTSLATAVSRARLAIDRGESSPHRAGAGLAAVVRSAARSAGAQAADLVQLETALREVVPPLLVRARPAVDGLPAELGDRPELLDGDRAGRPALGERVGGASLEAGVARSLRLAPAPGLPESVALDLHAQLAPNAPEALR